MSETRRLTGCSFIGQSAESIGTDPFHAVDPSTGERLQPAYGSAGADAVARACEASSAAFDEYRAFAPAVRATFLDAIAEQLLACGDALIVRAMAETGLPRARLEGERARTAGQMKLFAGLLREGSFVEARIDHAQPARKPAPRADLRQRHIGLGPVAVFGASNFPLAFSVAGGDTAAALAAGCPVVVKAHPAHPGTSELAGAAIQRAVALCRMPAGVFSLLFGAGIELGTALVADPRIQAVGFTGSRRAGEALMAVAAARRRPIPVYAEMSSVNPVYVLPGAAAERGETVGREFVASLTMGAGQFCTNPGLLIGVRGDGWDRLLESANAAVRNSAAATMLTPGIHAAYTTGLARMDDHPGVALAARGADATGLHQGSAALYTTDADQFLADASLQEEIFGAASLAIGCRDIGQLRAVAEQVGGQLTATLLLAPTDHAYARALLPLLERQAGRILVNGFPTGVEVCHAMVHGGPYPATADGRSTSVGSLAIRRFLRPVCYQDLPPELLPAELAVGNPQGIWRLVDGEFGRH